MPPPRRKCTFNPELQKEFPFLKKSRLSDHDVCCEFCNRTFSIANAGRSQITKHCESEGHKKNVLTVSKNTIVTQHFAPIKATDSDLELAAKEATIAYHTIKHDQSFRSASCTSNVIKNLFAPKFTCAQSKCTAIVTQVLYPAFNEKLRTELENTSFVSVMVDSSNHKSTKMFPVAVRYFKNNSGSQVKLLDIHYIPGETANILLERTLETLKNMNLTEKLICLSADNTNTNFGGVNRGGKGNVFYKLNETLKQNVVGVGCAAHIVHNTVQAAANNLPYDFDNIIVKICNHFSIYTVRCEKLKEFCDFVECKYATMLSTSKTRWLSLGPSLERFLQVFAALKSYFLSEKCAPKQLRDLFEDSKVELYAYFLHGQLNTFQNCVLQLEKQDISAPESYRIIKNLQQNLANKNQDNFIGLPAKGCLKVLANAGEIQERIFWDQIRNFYSTATEYLKMWTNPLEELQIFSWIDLRANIIWEEVEKCCKFIREAQPNIPMCDSSIYDDYQLISSYLTQDRLEKWNSECITTDERWVEIFDHFRALSSPLSDFDMILQFALAMPGTNAAVERIFSLIHNYWTQKKSNLQLATLRAVTSLKVNLKMDCLEFHKVILEQKDILRQIHKSQKYIVADMEEGDAPEIETV